MKIYQCGEYESITKKYFCPECGSKDFVEKEVSDHGTVYSFTKIHIAPPEFADIAPYNVVLVDLDEAACKVTTKNIRRCKRLVYRVTLDRIEDVERLFFKKAVRKKLIVIGSFL